MKKILDFQSYNEGRLPDIKMALDITRKMGASKFMKGVLRFLSMIDDVLRGNLMAAKSNYTNRSGHDKLTKIAKVLGEITVIRKKDTSEITFEDLQYYGIDPEPISHLKDQDVIDYLTVDITSQDLLDRNQDILDFLLEYANWYDNARRKQDDELYSRPDWGNRDNYKK